MIIGDGTADGTGILGILHVGAGDGILTTEATGMLAGDGATLILITDGDGTLGIALTTTDMATTILMVITETDTTTEDTETLCIMAEQEEEAIKAMTIETQEATIQIQ